MGARTVLVITHSADPAPARVIAELEQSGAQAVRLDTDRFPRESQLVLEQGPGRRSRFLFRDGDQLVDLLSVDSVWYRRFYRAELDPELDPSYRDYAQAETRTLLSALFAALGHARWVDPIERVHRAHHKTLQLEIAQRAGFVVPDTLTTNDPEAARRFFAAHPAIVTKMLNAISFRDDGTEQMVFTSVVTEEHLLALDGLRHCPAVFQEKVEKDVELRVAVVGKKLFVASVSAEPGTPGAVDWRQDPNLAYRFRPAEVPASVADCIHRVMDAFGLSYGSFDIIRRPDGTHVFLEVNSAGEWMWLAEMVGLPIAGALAELLAE